MRAIQVAQLAQPVRTDAEKRAKLRALRALRNQARSDQGEQPFIPPSERIKMMTKAGIITPRVGT